MEHWPDPLRIYYFLILADEEFSDMTPFQGFSRSWRNLHWAMRDLCTMPGDVSERSHRPEQIAVQRIAGMRPLIWLPLNVSALETFPLTSLPPCFVLFTGQPDVATRVSAWQKTIGHIGLHVSAVDGHGQPASSFSVDILRDHCLRRLHAADHLNDGQRAIIPKSGQSWEWPKITLKDFDVKGHNINLPNHMALRRLGYTLAKTEPFSSTKEEDYTDAILEGAASVALIRGSLGDHDVFALGARPPGVILFEPALYRHTYRRVPAKNSQAAAFSRAMRYFQQQRRLAPTLDAKGIEFFQNSREGRIAASGRSEELLTQTLGVGLLASQTTTPMLRLSPGVNHIFPSLSAYARNLRADRNEARRKAARLFSDVQSQLRSAVGGDRVEFITRTDGPVKIISDAPIEWLPIGNLPLSFARDCSRIPVTPGNVLMSQLMTPEPMAIPPGALREVLVISSFKVNDPLRNVLATSLEAVRPTWEGSVDLKQVYVTSVEEFKAALNGFEGQILIFDGHGVPNHSSPISKIAVGNEELDVWSLRGEVRCPPIVILSACDTHGIDASTHATVGNGFIALGARTVVGTFLPVDGFRSAMFIARLMHRVAEYIPAVIKAFKRAISWTEVVSGMLRMCLVSEIIVALVGAPSSDEYKELQKHANYEINGGDPEWFDKLIMRIAAIRQIEVEAAEILAQEVVARSDAVRYTQLGNPESLVLSDDTVAEHIMTERRRAAE